MKQLRSLIIVVTLLVVAVCTGIAPASAEDVKMVGTLSKIELSSDGKSATAVLKDNKTGESVTVIITDELTLDKFKDKRIVEGDEIRCKFEKEGGKNNSKIFKKTAGC